MNFIHINYNLFYYSCKLFIVKLNYNYRLFIIGGGSTERIVTLRKKNGNMLQQKVATKLGVSQELISKLESGQTKGSIDILVSLADLFHTSTDYLLERTDYDAPVDFIESKLEDSDKDFLMLFRQLSEKDKDIAIGFIYGLISKENKD